MPDTPSSAPNILGVIPARLASTRLPRKVLLPIAGRPMLSWVYQAARACPQLGRVVVATDAEEILDYARQNGMEAVLTPATCASGTDRVHAVSQQIQADIYVNIQGDEPMLTADHFTALLAPFAHQHVQVTTLAVPCAPRDVTNPNAVKVVTAADGRALYFSRATIPCDRDRTGFTGYRKHLGVYAYRKPALERFAALPPSQLEQLERLEQLRLLENGIAIHVAQAPADTIGVDTEEDRLAVERLLLARP